MTLTRYSCIVLENVTVVYLESIAARADIPINEVR
jgi:hypothetical protein